MESEKIGVCVGVLLKKHGKVLLGKRNEGSEKADSELDEEGTWTLPGGSMSYKESPEETARREVEEETGIQVDGEDLKKISVTSDISGDIHFITIGFMCDDFNGAARVVEPDQIVKWEWFELDELPSPIFSSSKKIIERVKSGSEEL